MKTTMKVLLALILALAVPFTAMASTAENALGALTWSTDTGDATGPAATFLAFGGMIGRAGTPVLDLVEGTSDLASARFYLLTENGDSTMTDAAYSSGGKVLPVTATTAFDGTAGAGSWVAIYNAGKTLFEINRVSSITAGVSLNLVRNTANTYASGSVVKELTSKYSALVANTTKDFWGKFNGEKGEVLGWYLDGTSACRVTTAGHYAP
jgi:hypothetical protein